MADVPLLTAITDTFGPSMWFNTIVALTHAAAAPPDGNNGPISYDTYTRTRTQLLQQNIRYNVYLPARLPWQMYCFPSAHQLVHMQSPVSYASCHTCIAMTHSIVNNLPKALDTCQLVAGGVIINLYR